ncbi:bola-like protein-domain-containing protein [Dunaliella salina]|uniref:Bola-like protein-domain-containing protein n=1 Tax=Dunaliella salina TaxID=3046 RepID=A0ABQ7GA42_DUNSA|nr:bola-like protein-domain-containing protein [Dunaliella salina]|eukprot:KAF5831469.1 bola-like protein-domain-containing protein [Dunaliella salina]
MCVCPSFIGMLGLQQSLTPSRNNGFLNMFKLMQRKTLETAASSLSQQEQPAASSSGSGNEGASSNGSGSQGNGAHASDSSSSSSSESGAASSSSSSSSRTPIQDGMRRKIEEALQPTQLVIVDESASHSGHAAMMAAPGTASSSGETHFVVQIVSPKFEGLPLVKRQRLVYSLLGDEFNAGLHALSLHTKTPAEVESK